MNSKISMIIRIIFALALLFFGSNKILHFMDPPPAPEVAWGYWEALTITKTMTLVAIVEIIAGLSLLLNKYTALTMLILMSVSINAVLYHATLDPNSIVMALVLLVLNIYMLIQNKTSYEGILKS
jgi:hypothetical protein